MTQPTTRGLLERSKLGELLEALAVGAVVYAPLAVREPEPQVELRPVAGAGAPRGASGGVVLDYANTRMSVKGLFFPQTQTMFRYDNNEIVGAAASDGTATVAFGVRPCDALALSYLDKIFAAGLTAYADPYYVERRGRSLLIALACSSPCSTCFCTAVGGSPAGKAGADVLATLLPGERLLLEAVTEKGANLIQANRALLGEAPEGLAREAAAEHERAEGAVPKLATPDGRVDREALKRSMDRAFEAPVWKGLTESCIGCGACTYLCPTCHCFDISDESRMYHGRRIRTWDSCQFPLFTKHASGHNPRPARKHRLRQRFMHKFSYTVEKSGDIYCVGCGRCVVHCPVNLDIREVIGTFSKPGA